MGKNKFFKNLVMCLFGATVLATAIGFLISSDSEQIYTYDSTYFAAAERIMFTTSSSANLNIIPKQGKSLDIKLYVSYNDSANPVPIRTLYGIKDSLGISFFIPITKPFFRYRIEYKESSESLWKSLPARAVKSPFKNADDKTEIIFFSDDHLSDDADMGDWKLQDPVLRQLRLNGDYVNLFLEEFRKNPSYWPSGELGSLMNGFCMASTLYQISKNENPDLIVNLGDSGMGFDYRWEGLGLKRPYEASDAEVDQYEKIFELGRRKIFSALSSFIPIYRVLGNHDGEAGWDRTKESATKYRKKYSRVPIDSFPNENCYYIKRGEVLIVALDVMGYNFGSPIKPEDWTLGQAQKNWLRSVLRDSKAKWKFVCFHHVLGGWPTGSEENERTYAYGRGPLFTKGDYAEIPGVNPNLVEQVEITRICQENGVDAILYGHDHIFHSKIIGTNSKGRAMRSICVGSTKYVGEYEWYKGTFWKKFSGSFGSNFGNYETYWQHDRPVDFWGPSGYTKLIIFPDRVEVEYVRSAYHRHTNIPPSVKVGDCVQKIVF